MKNFTWSLWEDLIWFLCGMSSNIGTGVFLKLYLQISNRACSVSGIIAMIAFYYFIPKLIYKVK